MNTNVPSFGSDSKEESIVIGPVLNRSFLGSGLATKGAVGVGFISPAQAFAEATKRLRPHWSVKSSRRVARLSKPKSARFAVRSVTKFALLRESHVAHIRISVKCLCFVLALMSLSAMAQTAPAPSAPAATVNVEPRLYISATEIAELVDKATVGAQSGVILSNGKSPFNGTTLVETGLYRARLEYHKAGPKATTVQFRANPNDAEILVVLDGSGTITFGSSLADATPSTNGSFVGKSLVGASSYKLAKGDIVMLPENSPHAITEVEGKLVMISLHLPHPAAVLAPTQAR
jgi:mannose-6-phosphate isomerase-like protein (cupin superfamily)